MSVPALPPLLRAGTAAVAIFLAGLVIGTLIVDEVLLSWIVAADDELEFATTVLEVLLFVVVAGAAAVAVVVGIVLALRWGARDRTRAMLVVAATVAVVNTLVTLTDLGDGGVGGALLAVVVPATAAFAAGAVTLRRL
jgi:hypothetical protein